VERRCFNLGPTKSRISPSILQYRKMKNKGFMQGVMYDVRVHAGETSKKIGIGVEVI